MAKILVVDDDRRICMTVQKYLEAQKHKVWAAGSGREALHLARRKKPDVIILDVMMPEMNGLEVLRHLKEEEKTSLIPVIMLTGRSDEETIGEAMYGYAVQYLIKPVPMPELSAKVDAVLETERRLRGKS